MDNQTIIFSVIPYGKRPESKPLRAYLRRDGWDDFHFKTLFVLFVSDIDGILHEIGGVKIGQFQMGKNKRSPDVPDRFRCLAESFFSLGQDDSYYEKLYELGEEICNQILTALRDIAADSELFKKAIGEDVMQTSLLRSVSTTTVKGQYRRLIEGGARLSRYMFSYKAPRRVGTGKPPIEISFEVEPLSNPPTNIHVLIGRNGVGKTYLLNLMTRALVEKDASTRQYGRFSSPEINEDKGIFANLVSVTFSAFDPFEPLSEMRDKSASIHYSYIGLKRTSADESESAAPKSHEMLTREFVSSVKTCLKGARVIRWRKAMEMLEADPIFREAEVTVLADDIDDAMFKKRASSLFNLLSSGHKIVLLTITRLVETLEERSLVLLDEPEAHLHPPLLSAFIRALSNLLVNRNAVAIIATHSPVVLQEVPKSCVWKLRRSGYEASAERPEIETFGENVSILTREVFGLEVTQSGFHNLLKEAIVQNRHYSSVINYFNGELGAEARAIVQALIEAHDTMDQG